MCTAHKKVYKRIQISRQFYKYALLIEKTVHSKNRVCLILFIIWFQDQYDSIAAHTQKGIEFLEKYGHFVDQRCKIEQEYASKLR